MFFASCREYPPRIHYRYFNIKIKRQADKNHAKIKKRIFFNFIISRSLTARCRQIQKLFQNQTIRTRHFFARAKSQTNDSVAVQKYILNFLFGKITRASLLFSASTSGAQHKTSSLTQRLHLLIAISLQLKPFHRATVVFDALVFENRNVALTGTSSSKDCSSSSAMEMRIVSPFSSTPSRSPPCSCAWVILTSIRYVAL